MLVSFRTKLLVISSTSLLILFTILVVILGREQERLIVGRIQDSAEAMVRNTSGISLASLRMYDGINLERIAKQTAAQNPDIRYVIIHSAEGLVYGHSHEPSLQFRVLADPVSLKALGARRMLTQQYMSNSGEPILEIATPVLGAGQERWGTVRAGFSLTSMHEQLRRTRLLLLAAGFASLCVAWLVSFFLARRVTAPLLAITAAAQSISRGVLTTIPEARTGDEVAVLSNSIADMTTTLIGQQEELKGNIKEITALKGYQESLLQTMNDGLVTLNMQGDVVTFNKHTLEILEIHTEDDGAARAAIRARLNAFEEIRAITDRLLSGASSAPNLRAVAAGPGGKVVLAGFAALGQSGKTREVIITLHDITELRRLEQEVKRNERLAAIGSFSAAMAHEIRNPLTAIKTYTGMVWEKSSQPEFLESFDRNVSAGIGRIEGIVNDLLQLSRPPKLHLEPLDIGEVLDDALALLGEDLESARVTLSFDREACGHVITGDREQLYRALFNIMLNAIQAMKGAGGGGRLEISAHPNQIRSKTGAREAIMLSIADTGPGIPPEILDEIFNPYFTTKGQRGTGLGLAITHKIIAEHGGSLGAANRQGGGAVFSVVLPIDGPLVTA
ncbi:sensor histidine kinase [Desulfocurvibacter africanus]|uniref:histidine kinase n=1 Tax=Desulfocurvibacter africanus subsp. africanus str. Walvis Bay TaxID=690850 RepID=F3Z0K6_DESAF|nr:ATP-binding protein [Desulfocurvibacter africanus]EGJ49830.1 integral membrane sensor signal transduction histidine kinase [Desulfocurvibacter africanus subsp. africanus str. Walvis Bay]